MLANIIEWSGRNRFLVLLATLFITIAGIYAVLRTPIDALPDLSDVQVIVYTEYPGQAPQVVEDQVTYPLTTAMLSVPKSKVVRGFSFFGASFVYIIFEDGTDIYWARSRVLEYLNFASSRMPKGVTPSLGPDATGVGWVYQYALLAKDKTLAELRTIQDWYVRYQLTKASWRRRSSLNRRLRADLSGHGRPGQAAFLRHPADEGGAGHPRLEPRCRRTRRRDG
jgi:Cu(I)/Ag(I) efflux system membrane protein CusA/SilA